MPEAWEMTGCEFWDAVQAKARLRRSAHEDHVALTALQTVQIMDTLVLCSFDAKGRAEWHESRPGPDTLFKLWTGQAEEEEAEKPFYTPELEGEEIQLN